MSHGASYLIRTRTKTIPYGTEASAAALILGLAPNDPVEGPSDLPACRPKPRIIRNNHERPGPARDGNAQRLKSLITLPLIVKGVPRADDTTAPLFVLAYLHFSQLRTALLTPRTRRVHGVRMVRHGC